MDVKVEATGAISVRFPQDGVSADMNKAGFVAEMAYRLRHDLGTFSPEVRETLAKMIRPSNFSD